MMGVKRPGREASHSPPSSAKVKKGGATCRSIPPLPHVFMASCLSNQAQGQLYRTLQSVSPSPIKTA
jgi:hypothetical protein